MRELASRHDNEPSHVALRWLIHHPGVPIPGPKTGAQAAINAGALSFELDDEEMDRLNQAATDH